MAHASLANSHHLLHHRWQVQQAHKIRDMATGLAHKTAKRLLAMAEFSNQFPISFGLFDRIKVLALDILNESDFQRFRIVEIANNGWNAMELGPLSGPPASLAGNDLVAPDLRPHNDGLNNATL